MSEIEYWHCFGMVVVNCFRKMRRQIVVFIIFLIVIPVSGQQKWTLENCIRYAIENNFDIKQSKVDLGMAEQNYRQSKWNLMPTVGASSGAGYSFGRTVVEGELVSDKYFYNDYSLGASMNIFNGFSLQNQISYNKFRKKAAENTNTTAVDNLAFLVMNSFYDVIYYEELLKITRGQKELSVINLKKTEILVKTGLKATADLLEVNANLEKDEFTCIQTENLLETAWINLRKAMNISPDSSIVLTRSDYLAIDREVEKTEVKTLYDEYSLWSSQIKSFENTWIASKKYLSIQKAGLFPSLRTSASYGTYFYPTDANSDFSFQLNANQNKYMGLSLSIPIFRQHNNITNIKLARLQSESAKNKLEQAKQELLYEMVSNYNDLKASLSEFKQANKQLEADTLAYQAAEKKYTQGMINVVDFYTAKNRMTTTTAQVLRSGLNVEVKRRIIDFYRGDRFWEK